MMSLLVKTHGFLFVCLGIFIAVSTAGISDDDIGFFNEPTESSLTPQFESLAETTPLFRLSPTLETLTLNQWVSEHGKKSVILIIDPIRPASFAQLIPFEKLAGDAADSDSCYAVIFLHRRPRAYLDHVTGIRPVVYTRFTAPITLAGLLPTPVIIYMDSNQNILYYKDYYCDYDCLKEHPRPFSSSESLVIEGDDT